MKILNQIILAKKEELRKNKKMYPLIELKQKVKNNKRIIRDFVKALQVSSKVKIIAEIKKSSPSLGDINTSVEIKEQAKIYELSGASAISVLTNSYFKGEIKFLSEIRKVTAIPILRKDFIFDSYQIYESYLAGADALLLIATLLDKKTLCRLVDLTHELGMECLVETHTKKDIYMALQTRAKIIGINARNLKNFKVNLPGITNLAKEIPKDRIIVAESGIKTRKDVEHVVDAGATVILVGTTLMKTPNIRIKIKELCINL